MSRKKTELATSSNLLKSGRCIMCGNPMNEIEPSMDEKQKLECQLCHVVVQIWEDPVKKIEEVKSNGEQKRKAFRKKETKVRAAKTKDSSKQSKTKSKVRKVKVK